MTLISIRNAYELRQRRGNSQMKKRILSLALAVTFIIAFVPAATAANSDYSDVPSAHWAYGVIAKWSGDGYGVLQGDGGSFFPDRGLSLGELAAILTRSFGYAEKADADVTPAWAAGYVQKAIAAGIIAKADKIDADAPVTREQAIKYIALAYNIAPVEGETSFADNALIGAEYKPYVNAFQKLGYVVGNRPATPALSEFMPKKAYTRAEAMQVISNTTGDIIDADIEGVEYSKTVIIRSDGVTVTDAVFTGDLIIGQGVGDGDVILDNVTVEGTLIVYGGGSDSIIIRSSNITVIVSDKTFGTAVRIVLEDSTPAEITIAEGGKTIIAGDAALVHVLDGAELTIQSGTIGKISVIGYDSEVVVNEGASVENIVIDAPNVTISGDGEIAAIAVTGNATEGVVINNESATVTVDSEAGAVIVGDQEIAPGGTSDNPSGGSADAAPPPPPPPGPSTPAAMSVSSSGVSGGTLNETYSNVRSLPLTIANAPNQAVSYGLVMRDANDFVHWTAVYTPPVGNPTNFTIPAGVSANIVHGRNGFGSLGYDGPAPKSGAFTVTIYALNSNVNSLSLGNDFTWTNLNQAMNAQQNRILATATLTFNYTTAQGSVFPWGDAKAWVDLSTWWGWGPDNDIGSSLHSWLPNEVQPLTVEKIDGIHFRASGETVIPEISTRRDSWYLTSALRDAYWQILENNIEPALTFTPYYVDTLAEALEGTDGTPLPAVAGGSWINPGGVNLEGKYIYIKAVSNDPDVKVGIVYSRWDHVADILYPHDFTETDLLPVVFYVDPTMAAVMDTDNISNRTIYWSGYNIRIGLQNIWIDSHWDWGIDGDTWSTNNAGIEVEIGAESSISLSNPLVVTGNRMSLQIGIWAHLDLQWYYSMSADRSNPQAISGATEQGLSITAADNGKYIWVEATLKTGSIYQAAGFTVHNADNPVFFVNIP
jgi:phosphatidylethanolamine-binding protein (PEBP) family uncharacterized protein